MPQCLVATVTPCVGARAGYPQGGSRGKRLSAPGCKEYVLGQGVSIKGAGQPYRSKAPLNKIDQQAPYAQPEDQEEQDTVWDSDNEAFVLCPQCRLPLGDSAYTADDDEGRLVHGECKAQLLLKAAKKEEESRLKKDTTLKKKRREQFDLGWKVERVPSNCSLAGKLDCGLLPTGLCSILWNQETKTVQVVPTTDHSASVNLEYLSLALRVRIQEGREAMFSLDPKVASTEPKDKTQMWQVKRFEPAWIEGTSLGEVMFQADYHLKELSMGEYAQPVVGMKSSIDYSEMEGSQQEWSAREWFVIRKAEVQLTQEGIAVPTVKMGVEARETKRGERGLEDVPLTRPDHPLVKYAQSFSHFFDLIAERKSVVYHLRELAKASVLAKFLVENEAKLDGSWTNAAAVGAPFCSSKEIPQLWNEHRSAQIQVLGGQIVNSEEGIQARTFGVYGGADLAAARVGVRAPPPKVVAARVPTLTARMISARGTVPEFAVGAPGVPKGVDLNLDQFNLGEAGVAAEEACPAWSGKEFLGRSFWENLAAGVVDTEHKTLLEDIYHPGLSDRRDDGDLFMPPSNSSEYISNLQKLLKEEATTRKDRREHFLSADFAPGSAGPLFPSSWTPSLDVAGERPAGVRDGLHSRPDYKADAAKLIKSATPGFDRSTEDGTRFRIYQVGSIEVRSIQEFGSEEEVGAVFSGRAAAQGGLASGEWSTVAGVDRVVKVSQYVEASGNEARRFYVVLETDQGDLILTEKRKGQKAVWLENPAGLEYRNSVAKVVRAADLAGCGPLVRDAKRLQGEAEGRIHQSNKAACKRYAHEAFLGFLPARQKAFAALSEEELCLADELGIGSAASWDEGRAEVFRLAWDALGSIRQEAAMALGYTAETWGVPGRVAESKAIQEREKARAPVVEKKWEEMSKAEQEERVARWFHENYGTVVEP